MLAHEYEKCVIVVTHDAKVASLADHVFYMDPDQLKLVKTK